MKLYQYHMRVGAPGESARDARGYVCAGSKKEAMSSLPLFDHQILFLRRVWFFYVSVDVVGAFLLYLTYALQAGYALSPALASIHHVFSGRFGHLVRDIHQHLLKGSLFSAVLKRYPVVFSAATVMLVQLGEQAGRLPHGCQQAHALLMQKQSDRWLFWRALAYPLVSFFALVTAFFVLMHTLVPQVVIMLLEQGKPLPWALSVMQAFCFWSESLSGVMYGCIIGFVFYAGRSLMRRFWASPFACSVSYLDFMRALVLLMSEGVALGLALGLACDQARHPAVKKWLLQAAERVYQGQPLGKSLSLLPRFEHLYAWLVQAGDRTGEQIPALQATVQVMLRRARHQQERLIFWIQPVGMIVVGLGFWLLIQGAVIPMYQLTGGNYVD